MQTQASCETCGNPIPLDAPSGLCPNCLWSLGDDTVEQGGSLGVDCPHCHHEVDLPPEANLSRIACHACGKTFNIVGESPVSASAGQRLAHFELQQKLGAGAFGSVWKAIDTRLERVVAVKIPRLSLDENEAESFFREARAAAQLSHTNIVAVHEIGREADVVFIVSDFIDGETLAEKLAKGNFNERRAARILAKLARALHHAHVEGVVHRDLKPGNIIIDRSGDPFLMDFGLAKRRSGEATLTMEGKVLGTPAYMSPEQAAGHSHHVDGRADIYALGVILFQMLTRELPFRGSPSMLLHQILNDDPVRPRRLNQSISVDLETICLKCMEKSPEKRYGDAAALAGDLDHFLKGEPIEARPVGSIERGWRWAKAQSMDRLAVCGDRSTACRCRGGVADRISVHQEGLEGETANPYHHEHGIRFGCSSSRAATGSQPLVRPCGASGT